MSVCAAEGVCLMAMDRDTLVVVDAHPLVSGLMKDSFTALCMGSAFQTSIPPSALNAC